LIDDLIVRCQDLHRLYEGFFLIHAPSVAWAVGQRLSKGNYFCREIVTPVRRKFTGNAPHPEQDVFTTRTMGRDSGLSLVEADGLKLHLRDRSCGTDEPNIVRDRV